MLNCMKMKINIDLWDNQRDNRRETLKSASEGRNDSNGNLSIARLQLKTIKVLYSATMSAEIKEK